MRAVLLGGLVAASFGCGGAEPQPEPAPVTSVGAEAVQDRQPAPEPPTSRSGPRWEDRVDPDETPPDVEAVPAYAEVTDSGLASHVLREGINRVAPTRESHVTVNYAGWTTDGQLFDSSWQRGRPASFPLTGVIRGWTEGVQLMREGEVRRFWIPADLAYGDTPRGNRPVGMLVFDVELLSVDSHARQAE